MVIEIEGEAVHRISFLKAIQPLRVLRGQSGAGLDAPDVNTRPDHKGQTAKWELAIRCTSH